MLLSLKGPYPQMLRALAFATTKELNDKEYGVALRTESGTKHSRDDLTGSTYPSQLTASSM